MQKRERSVGMRALVSLGILATACVGGQPAGSSPTTPEVREPLAPQDPGQTAMAATDERLPDGVVARYEIGNAEFTIVFEDPDDPPLPLAMIEEWVRRCASMIADYYGTFPVPSLEITFAEGWRPGVGFGQHWDGKWLKIRVGKGTSREILERDWVMVHEMLHAGYPDLSRTHRWMQEGLSTYLEPVVRARAGNMTATQVWGKWVRMMDNGRPRRGDQGLDITHTWGRVYWGGALFWLMVDLEIRKQSGNRVGLREALKGIVARGGTGRVTWSTSQCASEADNATNTTALADVYERMAKAPGDVDLDDLWHQLGVVPGRDGSVTFDNNAPLAHIRKSMTQ